MASNAQRYLLTTRQLTRLLRPLPRVHGAVRVFVIAAIPPFKRFSEITCPLSVAARMAVMT